MSRRVLILAHTGREESLKAAWEACAQLHDSGIIPVMLKSELGDMVRFFGRLDQPVEILHDHVMLPDVELVMVLGGDGTILRAAELVREVDVPLLGVNLGHVGFLAESERADLAQTVEWIASREYTVEERMTIDVQVWVRGQKIWHTWALNEAAIERATGNGCSRWSPKSTNAPSPPSAATALSWPPPPDPPPTRFRPEDRWCGPRSRRC